MQGKTKSRFPADADTVRYQVATTPALHRDMTSVMRCIYGLHSEPGKFCNLTIMPRNTVAVLIADVPLCWLILDKNGKFCSVLTQEYHIQGVPGGMDKTSGECPLC
jgi:hypothetical protein